MIKSILVIEAEPSIGDAIASHAGIDEYLVIRASAAAQAVDFLQIGHADLILLEFSLPDMTGTELLRRLRANRRLRDIPIILVSTRSGELDKIAGLDSGADDYVTKPFSTRELLARIKALLRNGEAQLTEKVIVIGNVNLDPTTRRASANGKAIELAPTEFRLLQFFMKRAERVLTRAQILAHVWGDHVIAEERTVDVAVRRLRMRLEELDHECTVDTVRGEGYRLYISGRIGKAIHPTVSSEQPQL